MLRPFNNIKGVAAAGQPALFLLTRHGTPPSLWHGWQICCGQDGSGRAADEECARKQAAAMSSRSARRNAAAGSLPERRGMPCFFLRCHSLVVASDRG